MNYKLILLAGLMFLCTNGAIAQLDSDTSAYSTKEFKNRAPAGITERIGGFQDESEETLINRLFGPSQFDSRVEIWQLDSNYEQHDKIRDVRNSVAMVVDRDQLTDLGDGTIRLEPMGSLAETFRLCPEEPFFDQPVVGLGTAFLVGEDTMCSALHVFQAPAKSYALIFGFEIQNEEGEVDLIVNESDVYGIKEFLPNGQSNEIDIAMFVLDRPANRKVLKWSESISIQDTLGIYSIGHPLGLPVKVSVNAHVIRNNDPVHFYTSLDAFRGNSGSPVFRDDTHEVIGVLVSGEPEFYLSGNCYIAKPCSLPDCEGERIVRSEQVLNQILDLN